MHFRLLLLLVVGWWSLSSASEGRPEKRGLFFKDVESEDEVEVIHVQVGGNVVLDCEAGGQPGPIIHWTRHGQRIKQGEDVEGRKDLVAEAESLETTENSDGESQLQLGATKSRLFLNCVIASDAGLYTCVAKTPEQRISKQFLLKVDTRKVSRVRRRAESHNGIGKHKVKDEKEQSTAAKEERCKKLHHEKASQKARIYMWTVHRMEVEGVDVRLYCRASGSGSVRVKWLDRNDRPIADRDQQYQILETGDLLIKKINWSKNMGLYRCIAENEFGSDEIETFLYPTSKQ